MSNLFLPMDNETGGLADEVSLLSTYLEVQDDNLNVIDSLSLFVKPNNGLYVVEAGGLAVNKIDIVEHDKTALPYSQAGQLLFRFLQKNSNDGKNRLIPVGKNVHFDVGGIQRALLNKNNWDKFVSYRMIDITGVALTLQLKGKLPKGLGLGLGSLIEYFGISIPGNQHEAKYDVQAQMLVYKRLLDLI